jgi:carnitine 3-dehydrogenase
VNITVLGSGTIGQSWCALFLAAGHRVVAYDPNPSMQQQILDSIARTQSALEALGYSGSGCSERLEFTTDAREAVKGSRFIQENAPEDLSLKHALYQEIEPALESNAVLLSSTSGFTLSELQHGLSNPSRLVIAHPFNPPHLIPLVEVLGNNLTTPGLVTEVLGFYESLGKAPIELKKSVPGHVANRLQAVLWQEVLHLAKEGVASLPDIDKAIANGPGLRWAVYGPNQLFSLAAGDQGLLGFIQHLGPSFERWWSSAGQVTFDEDTRRLIKQQCVDSNQSDAEEMKRQRDQIICQILSTKRAI